MSGGTRTVRVSRAVKVVKEKKSKIGACALKGKKTPEYRSDDFSSSSDDSSDDLTQKATKGNHSIKDLLEKIEEKDKMINDQVVEFKAIKCKGHLTNEQNEGARGVEVDGRGDKLCGDIESLLSVLSFSKIQVPQVWMDGNYA